MEQVRLWSHARRLACLSGHEFVIPAQQQSFVIRAAVYASARSRAMLRASSQLAVMRMKGMLHQPVIPSDARNDSYALRLRIRPINSSIEKNPGPKARTIRETSRYRNGAAFVKAS
jgi:hypothetical protein